MISHPALESGADYINELCVKLVTRLHQQGMRSHLHARHPLDDIRTRYTRYASVYPPYHRRYTQMIVGTDLSSFHKPGELRTANTDSMQKALTVFKLPEDGSKERIHRRVDLIIAAREVYWTAVTGWYAFAHNAHLKQLQRWFRTGSKMFERDLRSWAKD